MPIYEFHCNDCDKDFEYLVFGNDKPICKDCNNNNISKLMSACGFISKGTDGATTSSSSSSSCGSCSASSCSSCH